MINPSDIEHAVLCRNHLSACANLDRAREVLATANGDPAAYDRYESALAAYRLAHAAMLESTARMWRESDAQVVVWDATFADADWAALARDRMPTMTAFLGCDGSEAP